VTPKPVGLLVLTHAIQEFIFGAAAFEELGVPILAHRKTAELMQARCEHCLKLLKPLLGDGLTGTRLVLPTQLIDRSTVLEQSGRSIELIYSGWASTPGDLAVLDRTSGVVFTGGIVTLARVPEIRDSDFDGWINALSKLKALKPNLVVPGYGAISRGTAGIEATEAYLRALDHKVRDLYSAGRGLLDAVENAALEPFAGLALYDTLHRRNVLHRYLQLEIEDLGGDPRSTALPQ
jgi:glyoxylase-like metal-dependent hydrolase (beta-lactamase superfamily II)